MPAPVKIASPDGNLADMAGEAARRRAERRRGGFATILTARNSSVSGSNTIGGS